MSISKKGFFYPMVLKESLLLMADIILYYIIASPYQLPKPACQWTVLKIEILLTETNEYCLILSETMIPFFVCGAIYISLIIFFYLKM